jgi:protease IV
MRKKVSKKMNEDYVKYLRMNLAKQKNNEWGRKLKIVIYVLLILWIVSFFTAKIVSEDMGNKVAFIPIEGAIVGASSDFPFSSGVLSSQTIVKFLENAEKNKAVKAVVLEINSPGGTVVASKEIMSVVKEMDKPVVAWIREIGTSGAYWVASASDYIIADEMSLTGSIGVNAAYLEFSGLMNEYGVGYEDLKAGEYKDIGNPYEKLIGKEKKILQEKIEIIHEAFIESVAENRGLDVESVKEFSEGLYYLGVEGMDLGLIDEFGGKKEAKLKAEELAGYGNLTEVKYEVDKSGFFGIFDKLSSNGAYSVGRGVGDSLVESSVRNYGVPKA